MLIIVEGPDLAGKTTFIRTLTAELHRQRPDDVVNVTSAGPPALHPLDEYVIPLVNHVAGRHAHVICDRWHWGERVYPHLFNRPTEYDVAVHRYTELFLQSRGAVVVNVTSDEVTLRRRHRDRGDHLVGTHQLAEARDRFRAVRRGSILNGLTTTVPPEADVSTGVTDDTLELAQRVIALAAISDRVATHLGDLVTYIGHPHPEVLFLGDVRHEYRDCDPAVHATGDHRPAFMPYPNTSGHYLMRALTSSSLPLATLGAPPPRVGIMNTCDVDDAEAAWAKLGYPEVVTLGTNARRCFTVPPHWDGRLRAAPHPQYVRRFYAARLSAYRDQLLLGVEHSWRRNANPASPGERVG